MLTGRPSAARVGLYGSCLRAFWCALALFAPIHSALPQPEPAPQARGATLNIHPKRVVFDRVGKSATVYLFNQGDRAGVFDIGFVDRVMLPSGQILPLEDVAGQPEYQAYAAKVRSARPLLIATPRRVRLEPGAGQTIRLRAGSDAALAPGEYRTHLTVTTVPPPDVGLTAEQAAEQAPGTLSFRVASVLSLAIPVIVRVGAPDARASIENAELKLEAVSAGGGEAATPYPVLTFDLVRLGSSSLFGTVEIHATRERRTQGPLGIVRGIGVYPEIDRRSVKVPLRRRPAPGESLLISFVDDDVAPGKRLAELALPSP